MSEKHILCGFDVPEFEKRMKVLLKEKDIEATTYIQLSKKGVKDFIDQNPKCDTVILLEASNLKKSYTAEEIAALTDKRDINVIVVLSSRHIGTDYMKTLYVAGITNAIFQMGRNDGASAKDIVELILNKRNRQEARRYYGIEHLELDPTVMMDRDSYTQCMERLHKDDNLLLNYLQICSDMSPKQIADFTKRMPAEDRQYLAQFEEFHQLIDALKKMGVVIKVKRPKKTKIGLNVIPQINVSEDELTFVNNEELFHLQQLPAAEKRTEGSKKEVVTNTANQSAFTEDMFAGMSMEELIRAVEGNDVMVGETPQQVSDPDQVSLSVLKEAKRLEAEALEAKRKLDLEKEQFENERKAFEESKKEAQKELQKEEKRLLSKAKEVEMQAQKIKADEEKAKKRREKEAKEEIERRRREEADRVRRKELEKAEEDEDDEDAELFMDEKQFSGGFIIILLLLCVLAAGALYAFPYIKQMGLF